MIQAKQLEQVGMSISYVPDDCPFPVQIKQNIALSQHQLQHLNLGKDSAGVVGHVGLIDQLMT